MFNMVDVGGDRLHTALADTDGFIRPYVKVRMKLAGGKTKTAWALKREHRSGKFVSYRLVDNEGSPIMKMWLCANGDVVFEKPAGYSLKYGTMRLVK